MRAIAGLVGVSLLSGCVLDDVGLGAGRVSKDAVFQAASVEELIALGGIQLMEEEIIDAFAGQTMVEPNEDWTWEIREDGTHQARSNTPDWADDPNSIWMVVDNQFCRENQDLALWCSDVWQVGSIYRFTYSDGSLAPWSVTSG